jgi:predicted MFS family arabinose efflux permease
MIMPFASDFATHNLKITENQLSFVYILTGGITFISSLVAGYLSDKINRLYIFTFGTFLSICIVLIYTRLGVTDLWLVILLNCILFMGISSRIVPTQALMTSIPEPKDRGVFMSINSAIQQVSGGISALISGSIVYKNANEELVNYDIVGIVVAISMICAWLMFRNLFLKIKRNLKESN